MVFWKKEKKEREEGNQSHPQNPTPPPKSLWALFHIRDTGELSAGTAHVPVPPNSAPAIHAVTALHPRFSIFTHCSCRTELHPLKGENKDDKFLPCPPVCTFPNLIKKAWTDFNNMVKCRSGERLKEMLSYNST